MVSLFLEILQSVRGYGESFPCHECRGDVLFNPPDFRHANNAMEREQQRAQRQLHNNHLPLPRNLPPLTRSQMEAAETPAVHDNILPITPIRQELVLVPTAWIAAEAPDVATKIDYDTHQHNEPEESIPYIVTDGWTIDCE